MIKAKHALVLFVLIAMAGSCSATNRSSILSKQDRTLAPLALPLKGRNIIISYDDSQKSDYTKIYPVHKRLKAPAEFCIWIYQIDATNLSAEKLQVNELQEMYKSGMEIASHSYYHVALPDGILLKSSDAGSQTLHTNVDTNFTWARFVETELSNGTQSEIVKIQDVQKKDGQLSIRLSSPIINNYPAGSVLHLTRAAINSEASSSKIWLVDKGINCESFTYPFGRSDRQSEEIISHYYLTARIATPLNTDHSNIYSCIYENIVPNRYRINAIDFAYLSNDEIIAILSKSKKKNFLIYLFSHTYDPNCTPDKVEFVITEARKRGILITTPHALISGETPIVN